MAAAAEHGPLHQFEIRRIVPLDLGGYDISFTNSALLMLIAVTLATLLLVAGTSGARLVPNRWQSLGEVLYEFVAGMVRDNVGSAGKKYFPFVFTLFIFILFGNVIGLVPFGFAFTSHIAVTFAMAIVVFVGVTVIGFARHGLHFFSLFVPPGVPKVLLVLLVPIEMLSYMIRPITLSVRLFANMMAGHTMLFIFASFIVSLGIFGILPLAFTTAFMFLEVLVAVLQAYVFAILTCIYLHDAIHLH